uniref:RNA-binding protein Luc7-like 1 n=1 Tax=Timema cristinae TaxID=61476 RepID=A0A7R9D3L9_TIMCR|nr:unnamed protein product [Timema cristinae]
MVCKCPLTCVWLDFSALLSCFQRMDLGECPKIHDLALRADFEKASHTKDYYYDIDAMEHLQAFIADCDRRTELAKQRLAETQEELSAEVAQKANKVHELAEQIGKKLARAEQLGADGFIEDLRKKKNAAESEYRNSMPASSYQQQKLRVCEVCSAYLGIHDNDRRLADHFGGKLHLGFIKIREKLAELEKTVEERKQQKKQELKERDREREKERGGSSRDRDRERSRRRSRTRRSRSRSKSRNARGFSPLISFGAGVTSPVGPAVARSVLVLETNMEIDPTLETQRRKGELAVPSSVSLPHSRQHFTHSHLGIFLVQSREPSTRSSKMDEDSHRNKMCIQVI